MTVGEAGLPPGVWRRDDGVTREAGASARCVGRAMLMSFLTFLSLALAVGIVAGTGMDILRGLGLIPAGGKVVGVGEALAMLGASVLASVVAAGLGMYAALLWLGSTVVRVRGGQAEVSTGIGPLRLRSRLGVEEAVGVSEVVRIVTGESGSREVGEIVIERRSGHDVRFGSLVGQDRLAWLGRATAELLGVPMAAWSDHDDETGDRQEIDEDGTA